MKVRRTGVAAHTPPARRDRRVGMAAHTSPPVQATPEWWAAGLVPAARTSALPVPAGM